VDISVLANVLILVFSSLNFSVEKKEKRKDKLEAL
jgi:hypothetical protein